MTHRPPDSIDLRIETLGVADRPSTDVFAIVDRSVATALSYIRQKRCMRLNVDEVVKNAFTSRSQLEKKFRKASADHSSEIRLEPSGEILRNELSHEVISFAEDAANNRIIRNKCSNIY
ncbi:MAG TPA: hypothetical protein VIM71_07510 [Lacunisphaera sp.]